MTTNPPNELDEIKLILRALAEQQTVLQTQQQALQTQQERTQQQLDHLARVVETSIPDLTDMVGTVLSSLDEYTAEMRAIQAADRAERTAERLAETRARNDFRTEMRGLQNESRNLLRELADFRRDNRAS
jgi:peptidoglycan hydrolase CwlO-like protein